MKSKHSFIIALALVAGIYSCEKDNYSAPNAKLSGRIVYQGEAIGVETNQVPYELYQYGFGKVGPIAQSFAQDGSYSSLLFNGDYKLIIPNGQGPFMWKYTSTGAPDSISVTMSGDQTLDLDVTPYYMIRTPQITGSGSTVTATCKAEKIITDANAKDIERVSLYINKTQFVSGNGDQKVANTDLAGSAITDMNNISLSVTVPGDLTPTQAYVYARIGLKIAGVEDMIFSPVVKIQL